jgi:maleate cis-trans isomerase
MKAITEITQEELTQKVQELVNKGCKLPIEKIEAIVLKSNKASLKSANKFDKKQEQRDMAANTIASTNASVWLAEKNRENALLNLPSTLR